MEHLTEKELKQMAFFSYEKIEKNEEEINKINVFPIPDQDTGSNMVKTLLGIKEAIEGKEFKDLTEISEAALEGALSGAQGNAGVIYTGFLAGFLPQLDKNPADAKRLAIAFERGAARARQSIQNPKEGTILDVIDSASQTFSRGAEREKDIASILKRAIERANGALLETREKLEVLKKANVVDAGGLAFFLILEGYLEALEGKSREEKRVEAPSFSPRYEIVSLIENVKLDEGAVKTRLKKLGNYLDVVQVKDKIKTHIHTDYPDEVKDVLKEIGQVKSLTLEDMAAASIGIVTEDIAMLLPKIIERYQIELVFAKYNWPEEKNLPGENIYQKMREAEKQGIKTFPKTSQATPKSYLDAIARQLKKFDKVLCITVSSKISGCYSSAKQAEAMAGEPDKVFVLDSQNAAAGQALLVLRAIELIQEQKEINEVLEELKSLIPKTHLYFVFKDPKWIEALGRITKSQANWIRRMKRLNLHPIMEMKDGIIGKGGIVFAKDSAEALFKKISKASRGERKEGRRIRVVIGHADNFGEAEKLEKLLKEKISAEVPFLSLGPPVVCAGAGPGTLLVGWTVL